MREVLLKPHKWTGPGYVGCEVGTGLFNQMRLNREKNKDEREGEN